MLLGYWFMVFIYWVSLQFVLELCIFYFYDITSPDFFITDLTEVLFYRIKGRSRLVILLFCYTCCIFLSVF